MVVVSGRRVGGIGQFDDGHCACFLRRSFASCQFVSWPSCSFEEITEYLPQGGAHCFVTQQSRKGNAAVRRRPVARPSSLKATDYTCGFTKFLDGESAR